MNINDVYFAGLQKFVKNLNDRRTIHAQLFFKMHDRDTHVSDRAIERKIDLVGLLKESKKIINDHLCLIVYHIHANVKQFTIKTNHGHLVFRVHFDEMRNGYIIKLCTITAVTYAHDRDVIIGERYE